MDFDEEALFSSTETGSDELLSDDNLRLPDNANILVRVHAVKAWLQRRQKETTIEAGEAALALQEMMMQPVEQEGRLRRRERQRYEERTHLIQHTLEEAQERLKTYEEAEEQLEECIAHTGGERTLVEYYLMLEDAVQSLTAEDEIGNAPRLSTLADIQRRVEHVSAPGEEE